MTIPLHNSPAAESGWTEAARIYRRICLVRAQGNQKEADELEATAFAAALEAVRDGAGDAREWESLVQQLKEAEERRVGEAATLAELLAPMLAKHLHLPRAAPGIPAITPHDRFAPPPGATRAAPRGIADFIDEMLAQNSST